MKVDKARDQIDRLIDLMIQNKILFAEDLAKTEIEKAQARQNYEMLNTICGLFNYWKGWAESTVENQRDAEFVKYTEEYLEREFMGLVRVDTTNLAELLDLLKHAETQTKH